MAQAVFREQYVATAQRVTHVHCALQHSLRDLLGCKQSINWNTSAMYGAVHYTINVQQVSAEGIVAAQALLDKARADKAKQKMYAAAEKLKAELAAAAAAATAALLAKRQAEVRQTLLANAVHPTNYYNYHWSF
jgi:hypothetical protein